MGVGHIAGHAAVGTPDARGSFGLEFCKEVGLGLDLDRAGGVKGGMASFAVGAVEGGSRAAAGNSSQVSILRAQAVGPGAAVLGVGVVFAAQGAGGVFLLASGLVVPEGKAFDAVGGCGRRAESSNTACAGD